MVVVGVDRRLAGDLEHQPWRDDDRDEEGKDHRGGRIGRDGAHVRPHHAGDEEHRQKCGHDRQGGDDGRVADLGHRLDGGLLAVAPVAHAPVTRDVFDHDDGVVDQDADRKDERKQRDAVQRVAHDARGEECEQDGDRNDNGDNQRLAPADGQPDEQDDRNGREAEMVEQFVGLFVRRFTIVARDLDDDIGGDQRAFQLFDALKYGLGDRNGVGAGALGNGERDGGRAQDAAVVSRDV